MRIALALVLVLVAAVGCTGETAAVLVEHDPPDGQAEASADGPSPAADASQEHDAEGGPDGASMAPRDAAGDKLSDGSTTDVVDEQLDAGGDVSDGGLRCDEDAGFCSLPDGALCCRPAADFGCTVDPNPVCTDSRFAAYDCATAPPPGCCYAAGPGRYCCEDEPPDLCPPQ